MARTPEPLAVEIEFSDLDLHFGRLMTRFSAAGPEVALAAGLASRATSDGDVCVHLAAYSGRLIGDEPAPPLDDWLRALRASSVVGAPGDFRPLVLDAAGRLYLYRYWDYEKRLAGELLSRAVDADNVDMPLLRDGLARYFPEALDSEQKLAAAIAVLRRLCVISGGPGTGKTTTVVKILALLAEQAKGRKLAIALAAPTGKAAARVQDAVRAAIDRLALDNGTRASIPAEASTIHRLLGARPGTAHYRHDRDNPLPLDVLVVDEASMADLALATKLLEALPPHARLILLGDKDQLASVEAGAVLGDICRSPGYSTCLVKRLSKLAFVPPVKGSGKKEDIPALADSIAFLQRSYRFGPDSGIGTLARLVNEGDGAGALALIGQAARNDIAWRSLTPGELRTPLASSAVEHLRAYFDAVRQGDAPETLFELFGRFRVLCALRNGPVGVNTVNRLIEDALESERLITTRQTWYPGRPVMITRNDYNLRLFNGDVGIALPDAQGRLKVCFPGSLRSFAPSRLPDHETVYAMTIHKAQGSEFGQVLMILPGEASPVMSRELVYTGITRAMQRVEIWGDEEVFAAALRHPLERASGLRDRLWGVDSVNPPPPPP